MKNRSLTKSDDQMVYTHKLFIHPLILKLIEFISVLYATDEIVMHEGVTAVYKSNVDLFFCVLGAQNENEVINCKTIISIVHK